MPHITKLISGKARIQIFYSASYLLSGYYAAGTVGDVGNAAVNKTKFLPRENFHSRRGDI